MYLVVRDHVTKRRRLWKASKMWKEVSPWYPDEHIDRVLAEHDDLRILLSIVVMGLAIYPLVAVLVPILTIPLTVVERTYLYITDYKYLNMYTWTESGVESVMGLALSQGGAEALVLGETKACVLSNLESEQISKRVQSLDGRITCRVILGGGRKAVGRTDDGKVWLFDAASGHGERLVGHLSPVTCTAISSDGRRVLTASLEKLILWDTTSRSKLREIPGYPRVVQCVALSADGRRALTGESDVTASLWDIEKGLVLKKFEGRARDVSGMTTRYVDLSSDSRRALFAYESDGVHRQVIVEVWNAESGECERQITLSQLRLSDPWGRNIDVSQELPPAFSADGTLILLGGLLYDVVGGRVLFRLVGEDLHQVTCHGISANGGRVVAVRRDGRVFVWNVPAH
jgi:WD40 repeat protein